MRRTASNVSPPRTPILNHEPPPAREPRHSPSSAPAHPQKAGAVLFMSKKSPRNRNVWRVLWSVAGTLFVVLVAVAVFGILFLKRAVVDYRSEHDFSTRDPSFFASAHAMADPLPLEGNAVQLLHNGDEIFPAMLTAIRAAKASINFEAFLFDSDDVGRQFRDALCERARAGVRVRVLLDGIGSGSEFCRRGRGNLPPGGLQLCLLSSDALVAGGQTEPAHPPPDSRDRWKDRLHRRRGFRGSVVRQRRFARSLAGGACAARGADRGQAPGRLPAALGARDGRDASAARPTFRRSPPLAICGRNSSPRTPSPSPRFPSCRPSPLRRRKRPSSSPTPTARRVTIRSSSSSRPPRGAWMCGCCCPAVTTTSR